MSRSPPAHPLNMRPLLVDTSIEHILLFFLSPVYSMLLNENQKTGFFCSTGFALRVFTRLSLGPISNLSEPTLLRLYTLMSPSSLHEYISCTSLYARRVFTHLILFTAALCSSQEWRCFKCFKSQMCITPSLPEEIMYLLQLLI
jgi:hypothetical protein